LGLYIGKFDKKSTDLLCLIIQFAGLGALFGNLSPKSATWRQDYNSPNPKLTERIR